MELSNKHIIGIDFGTDSVRSVLVDAAGNKQAESVFNYPRWREGLYCDSSKNRFRHHPLDYLEGLESTLKEIVQSVSTKTVQNITGIGIDTTGSTPVAVDQSGTPLALNEDFAKNPNAMFILWKDHTAVQEASEITEFAKTWNGPDYTKYIGGIYSSEWFWAKILHTLRSDKAVREAAYSWVELCDWIPYLLTGQSDVHRMKRSRCAAGHKAMWHQEFGGLPSEEFLTRLDPLLAGIRDCLYEKTYTSNEPAGTISQKWASNIGLPEDVVIGVGAFDAHMGAVGGEIEPHYLSRVMGTSTCDIMVAPYEEIQGNLVQGICGQVDGSVIPGMIGLEAGQSGFGDVYAWYKKTILSPVEIIINNSDALSDSQKTALLKDVDDRLLDTLSEKASAVEVTKNDIIALDWLNGRRTPDANQMLTATIEGLDLGTDSAKIFKSLVEATCFGAKAIVERFQTEGIRIDGIIGLGGVAKKSPFVMQTLSSVLNMPIKIAKSDQVCALGAAMFAAVASGLFDDITKAKEEMGGGFGEIYEPERHKVSTYKSLYKRYQSLGSITEQRIENQHTKQTVSHE